MALLLGHISYCTVQYYFVLSTTARVRLLYVNKRVSQSVSQSTAATV